MPAFRYKALAQSGAIDQGVLTAKDVASAQRQLRVQKLTPLSVNHIGDASGQPSGRAG